MDTRAFTILVDMLKIVDTETLRRASITDSIKRVLDFVDRSLSADQKQEIMKELRVFSLRKSDDEDVARLRQRLDEERYREMIQSFYRTEEASW